MEKISWADRVRNGEVLQRVKGKRKYPAYEEQIEVRKCLLSFGAEPFVFQVAIQKFKDQDI